MIERSNIIDVLKECYDPEIPIDLWSLGLIYNISIVNAEDNKADVNITMTLTTPGCSMGSHMAEDIKMKLKKLENINAVEVEVTFDPPWKPEMMNDDAREKLGFTAEGEQEKNNNEESLEQSWE